MKRFVIVAAFAMCAFAATTHAATPSSITVQGRLTDAGGIPITVVTGFEFRIFSANIGGVQIWPSAGFEFQNVTPNASGLWTTSVGALVSLTDAVFSDTVRWLQITAAGTTLPRVRLVTGPYTFRVSTVDGASGGHITSKLTIGPNNVNSGFDGFVAGSDNTATDIYAVIAGGTENVSANYAAVVSGGTHNVASGHASSVGGGHGDTASGYASRICGGVQNVASGLESIVGGGLDNTVSGYTSAVFGGQRNVAQGDYAVIVGGRNNIADGDSSIIVGGTYNTANGHGAVVVGGSENHARGNLSFIGGGGGMDADSNSVHGDYAVAVGGSHSIARGDYSFVGGGDSNFAYDPYNFVGGGQQNHCEGGFSAIVGGRTNEIQEAQHCFVGGGRRNRIQSTFSSIVGGDSNIVTSAYSIIGGGKRNSVFGSFSAVLGGQLNDAGGAEAVCLGGHEDTADAALSVVLGGYRNRTLSTAKYSVVAGKRAKANHAGCFVWADSTDADFATSGINQFLVRATGGVGVGTASPEGPLHVQEGSAGTVTANTNSVAVFESSTDSWVSILGPSSSEKGILFSDPGLAIAGGIVFDHGGGGNDMAFRTGGNTTNMVLDGTGNLNVTGNITATGTCCASDARFKKNVNTIPDALERISMLRGVEYDWRCDEFTDRNFSRDRQTGLIAQEVRAVIPSAVVESEDGYLAVDYTRIVPLLLEAIKEQQSLIEKQNERIANLEKKLEQ